MKTKLIIFEINYKRFTDIPKSDLSPQSTENGQAQFSRFESESSKTRPLPQLLSVPVPNLFENLFRELVLNFVFV